jgi:beta-barrel assembly-enhancing protease
MMTRLWLFGVGFAALLTSAPAPAPRVADETPDDEQQIGQQTFEELKAKGEIIASSPLYDTLTPITTAITRTAQPRYKHPFKFYLVHEREPNAFSVPGGNVFVTDSLLYFVRNSEQLAGTLGHEVSHTIHHDSMKLIEEDQHIARRELGAAILLGPTASRVLAITLIGRLHSLGYSREAESAADITGSDLAAASGYNPWGLVWLFQDFDKADTTQVPQLLSDHPDSPHRVAALQEHFRERPDVFGSFSPDPASAKAFVLPKNAAEVFIR